LPCTLFEFLDESLYMGIDDITGHGEMLTGRRDVVPVLYHRARWGEVTDLAAQ
jgi:hypothetical protein